MHDFACVADTFILRSVSSFQRCIVNDIFGGSVVHVKAESKIG
ncbi:hypothetical protein FLHKCMKP_CDS0078 [Escherichia phage KS_A3]